MQDPVETYQFAAGATFSETYAYLDRPTDSSGLTYPVLVTLSDLVGMGQQQWLSTVDNYVGTTTTLVGSGDPLSLPGQTPAFTATVTAANNTIPTGWVKFCDGNPNAILDTVQLTSGTRQFTAANLTLGDHQILAIYLGDTGFAASQSDACDHVVLGFDSPAVRLGVRGGGRRLGGNGHAQCERRTRRSELAYAYRHGAVLRGIDALGFQHPGRHGSNQCSDHTRLWHPSHRR